MSNTKFHVKKGDFVEVTSGAHKGSRGPIIEVVKKDPPNKVYVIIEGVRMIKKAVRPSQERPQGGFLEREGTIHISNVKLVEKTK